jgi:hypothetical protein
VDPADAALVSHGMAVVKPHAKAAEVDDVEVAGADLPMDVAPLLCGRQREVQVLLK